MVGNQHETLDDVTAERLLDGTDGRRSALARLLARAAGPATAAELTGEAAALAAFRSARLSPGRSRRRWLVAVAALVFTFASTGVAVAAATGVLPSPFGPPKISPSDAPTRGPSLAEAGPGGSGNGTPGSSGPPPAAAIDGLCSAYLAQVAAGHGDELRNPRFDALATLAGGADRVAAYCAERTPEPTPTHSRSEHPTGPPTNPPGPHATNPNQPAK